MFKNLAKELSIWQIDARCISFHLKKEGKVYKTDALILRCWWRLLRSKWKTEKKTSFMVELSFSDWCKNVCKYGVFRDLRFDWDRWNLWIEGNGRAAGEEAWVVARQQVDWEVAVHSPPATFREAINYADWLHGYSGWPWFWALYEGCQDHSSPWCGCVTIAILLPLDEDRASTASCCAHWTSPAWHYPSTSPL